MILDTGLTIIYCILSEINSRKMDAKNATIQGSKTDIQNHIKTYVLNTDSRIESVFAYFWNILAALIAQFLFRVLNRTVIEGRSNYSVHKNTLFVSNHQTLIDSFFIGGMVYWPTIFWKPAMIPWHPAALENFFRNKFLAFCSKFWKCIPIKRGARDFLALNFMIDALKSGTIILFPEGTRSRTGKIGRGKIGVGKLVYDAKPVVIPVAIAGMNKVLPIGAAVPRIFKLIRIKFGKPLVFDDLFERSGSKETSQEIVNRMMDAIQELKSDLDGKMEKTSNSQSETVTMMAKLQNFIFRIPIPFILLLVLGIYFYLILFFI